MGGTQSSLTCKSNLSAKRMNERQAFPPQSGELLPCLCAYLANDGCMAPQVVIFCDLQKPIRVVAELMGKSLDAVIDGRTVKIHMPEFTWETILRFPELQMPKQFVGLPMYETTYAAKKHGWGQVLTCHPEIETFEAVELHRLCVSMHGSTLDGLDAMERHSPALNFFINHQVPLFFHALSDWIEVWTRQIGSQSGRAHRMPNFGEGIVYWVANGENWQNPYSSLEAVVGEWNLAHPIWGIPANWIQIQAAIQIVSQSDKPDFEELMLRDARESWAAGQPRKAVLEAGLAVELVLLHIYQEKRPNPSSKSEKEKRKQKVLTLGNLIHALRRMGMNLPETMVKPLLEIRNLAAHHAVTITEEQTRLALVASDAIFESFYTNSNPAHMT
jgi:hypothetical protein